MGRHESSCTHICALHKALFWYSLFREGPSAPCWERQSAEPQDSAAWGSSCSVSLGVNLLHISFSALTAHLGTLGAWEVKTSIFHLQKGACLTHTKALLKLTCTKALLVGTRIIHPRELVPSNYQAVNPYWSPLHANSPSRQALVSPEQQPRKPSHSPAPSGSHVVQGWKIKHPLL